MICSVLARDARQFTGRTETIAKLRRTDYSIMTDPSVALERKITISKKRGRVLPHVVPDYIKIDRKNRFRKWVKVLMAINLDPRLMFSQSTITWGAYTILHFRSHRCSLTGQALSVKDKNIPLKKISNLTSRSLRLNAKVWWTNVKIFRKRFSFRSSNKKLRLWNSCKLMLSTTWERSSKRLRPKTLRICSKTLEVLVSCQMKVAQKGSNKLPSSWTEQYNPRTH